jgi:hypothetical protein
MIIEIDIDELMENLLTETDEDVYSALCDLQKAVKEYDHCAGYCELYSFCEVVLARWNDFLEENDSKSSSLE